MTAGVMTDAVRDINPRKTLNLRVNSGVSCCAGAAQTGDQPDVRWRRVGSAAIRSGHRGQRT